MITFKEEVLSIAEYKIGDSVTRENFTPFLISSFALSRGLPEIQRVFFLWQEKIVDFSFSVIFENLINQGGVHLFIRRRTEFI